MKRFTKPMALALAISGGGAVAAESPLYGVAHLSIDSIHNGDTTRTLVSSNSSLIGIKGQKSVGEALEVLYQFEGGVEWGTDRDAAFSGSRDSYLGLRGRAGSLLVGRLPYHNLWAGKSRLFSDQIGDSKNLLNDDGEVEGGAVPGSRIDKTVQYTTPSFHGGDLLLSYTPNDDFENDYGDVMALRAQYRQGPIYLGLTHIIITTSNASDPTSSALVANYDLGTIKLVAAMVADQHREAGDRDAWTVGSTAKLAGGVAKLQYTHAGDWSEVEDTAASMITVGYDYPLDDKTTLWAAYAQTDNSTNSAYGMSGGGHGAGEIGLVHGEDPRGFGIGVIHRF